MIALALAVAAVLLALAVLHVYWAAGGRVGASAAVPEVAGQPAFVPGPNATLGVALALTLAALIVLGRAGLWTPTWPPHAVFRVGTWVWALIFLLRAMGDFRLVGFFKRASDTRFARRDTLFYSPLCLALGVALLALARS
jgi:hypothetical protein